MADSGSSLIPLVDQIACVEREIKYRVRVYARRIAEGKMTLDLAERETNAMRGVLATLHALQDRREPALF